MINQEIQIFTRPGFPDFLDLPWHLPLNDWEGSCSRLEEAPKGLHRHPIVFVNYSGSLFALKELPGGLAQKEYDMLASMEEMRLPAVSPVGHVKTVSNSSESSVLITQYLDRSLPYRSLFMRGSLERYRETLLDAIAGLLVQLHLSGVFWGDCSLSNTLFRRDAGALQAYLVDAETAEIHPDYFPPSLRHHDMEIMEDSINGELRDLQASDNPIGEVGGVPVANVGSYIRVQYQKLWEAITKREYIRPEERYRIQERIRALNNMGFSVRDVELVSDERGELFSLRPVVTDRNFHRDLLHGLTGVEAEEGQARLMVNEIQELKATLSQQQNRSTPLSVAAYHWVEHIFEPTLEVLSPLLDDQADSSELYCQLLEHKWYLSERARHDVGHRFAAEDFLNRRQPT